MRPIVRISLACLSVGLACALSLTAIVFGAYYFVEPGLPGAEELRDVRLKIPLTIYSRDGRLIAQIGEEQRTPAAYDDIPVVLINALLAAEDDRFFDHPGFDYQGLIRAALSNSLSGSRSQGGSTITQQLARMYFLTRERTFVRKFKELILATRIEREFSKQEILELYLNTYFFGKSAYGVTAATQVYFGKELSDLSLSDAAILAGIPRAPSVLNPVANPDLAGQRRSYVLRRMRELNFITDTEYQVAIEEPISGNRFGLQVALNAPYVSELVRSEMIERLGLAAYTSGLKITTTIDSRLQNAATDALRRTLIEYDERHGYRGALAHLDISSTSMVERELTGVEFSHESWKVLLSDYPNLSGFETGLVVSTDFPDELKKHSLPEEVEIEGVVKLDGAEEIGLDNTDQLEIDQRPLLKARVYLQGGDLVEVGLDSVEWAAPYINENAVGGRPKSVIDVLEVGHVVRFRRTKNGLLRLSQVPEVQGAIVAMDPTDGGISAMVGGFDFSLSNFNRTTQSKRQPGSSFKPFVYSAALEQGYTAATIVNDAPIVIDDPMLEDTWRPENYSGTFSGETRLREALVRSLNLVSVRVIRQAGVGNTVRHLRKFGFDGTALPANSTLALGSGGVAPVDLAAGYAVFANGGYAVNSHLIERIEDTEGKILYETSHPFVCRICESVTEEQDLQLIHDPAELYPKGRIPARVISAQNAFLIRDMMADVVRRGTGRGAYRELGREDLAGKTGTSNERRDAWFAGFNGDLVAAVWVGFDQERSLGRLEEGGRTALPMWNYFMAEALKGLSDHILERPPGVVDVRINPETGLVSRAETAIIEQFRLGHVPQREDGPALLADSLVDAGREEREDTEKKPIF
ncbi:uncharacterized protein METZ01_LOCUS127238 [marine metagenome]|uniref:Penicillin-binding protein 1A n=1 Tax=marine metagenome TaxID=408172 RepID=A0A381YBM4_9ZZZZ